MQLDRTYIAIRERDMLDIMDLALMVIRSFAKPLAITILLGVLPIVIFQHWLLGGFDDMALDQDVMFSEMQWRWLTLFKCCVFPVFFAPLASVPTTVYLGQALFSQQPNPQRVFRDWLGSLPQIVLLQLLVRSLLISVIYVCLFDLAGEFIALFCVLTVLTCALPLGVWPYLTEIIVLERNPLFSRGTKRTSTMRRSGALHRSSFSELLARGLVAALYGIVLAVLLFLSMWLTKFWLSGNTEMSRLTFLLFLEIATWVTICYFMVARFLCYLDLRIRREGWEVELKMRAEGARLTRQLV